MYKYGHLDVRPCKYCTHFLGWNEHKHAICGREPWGPGRYHTNVHPRAGCAFWRREPGTDDDWDPKNPEPMNGPLYG